MKREDFFSELNRVTGITDEDYLKTKAMIHALDSVARSAYESFYIIDYHKKNFLYVSENPLFLCGCTPENAEKMGHGFFIKYVPENEHSLLLTINRAGFMFFNSVPVEDRMEYLLSYDFHLGKNYSPLLVNNKLKPLLLDKNGRLWLGLCMVSLSSHKEAGHVVMHHQGTADQWEYSLAEKRWFKLAPISLTAKERLILILSAKGYTMEQISDKAKISTNTIKFHKRKIFQKLNVQSITEALICAINQKML